MGFLQEDGQGGGEAGATASTPGLSTTGQDTTSMSSPQAPRQSFGDAMAQRYPIATGLANAVFGGQNGGNQAQRQQQAPQLQMQQPLPPQDETGQSYIPRPLLNNPIFKLITGI